MRVTWIAGTAFTLLGQVVSGCSCTPMPKAPPAPSPQAAPEVPPIAGNTSKTDAPLSYKDAGSGITIIVESDRRHVSAINPAGKILWHRNVVKEDGEKIKKSRQMDPLITSVETPAAWELKLMERRGKPGPFAGVIFCNGSSGVIDMRTGELAGMRSD